jgi:NADH-quinone oxidoreductase subunit L
MEAALTLIVVLPILAGALIALAGSGLHRRFSELAACGAVGGAFAASLASFLAYRHPVVVQPGNWFSAFGLSAPFSFGYDPLAAVMCLMVTFVSGLILVYSVNYMAGEEDYARFYALMTLFVGAMLLLVLADNLPLMYLGWEGVGFCSYGLIGFWYRDGANADAGRKAFLVTRIGDVAFSIAIFWLFTLCGTVSLTTINGMPETLPAPVVTAVGLLLLGGAMGKSAQMPLMVWLPDAMAGPTPVSALIHAATMVTAGVYLLIRFFPLIGSSATVCAAIAVTGALTAFYAATCAIAQRDIKRILAYSTMSQIGYMMLGVGSGALTAATFHLVEHAFYKSLLFLGAGCVITALHHEQDIYRMGGLRRAMPGTYWPFLAGAACLAGLPLTGGFFSKEGILEAVFARGGPLYLSLYVMGTLTAFLTVVYTFRMVYVVFHGEDRNIPGTVHFLEMILVPLALLGFFGEVMNLPEYLGMGSWLEGFLHGPGAVPRQVLSSRAEVSLQVFAAAVAVGGLLLARARFGNGRRCGQERESRDGFRGFLANGWYFDGLYRVLFVEPFLKIARILRDPVEERVVVPLPDRIGAMVADSGRCLAKWSCGRVSVYLVSFAAGAALLLGYLAWLVF